MAPKHTQNVSAVDLLNQQLGKLQDPSVSEKGSELVDIQGFLFDVVRQHGLDLDVTEAITDGYIERTMDGPSTLQVTIQDEYHQLLNSGIFGDGSFFRFDKESTFRNVVPNKPHFRAIDVNIDGLWMRLAQIQKDAAELTLTFEDRIVAYLKLHNSPRKASRAHMTRAQFIRMLVNEIKAQPIEFISPELEVKQPIDLKKLKTPTDSVKRHDRKAGLLSTADLNVKHTHATPTQLENAQAILDTGTAMGANRKCLVCSIMVPIQESDLSNAATNGTHVGMFQQDASSGTIWRQLGGASRDAVKDAKAFFKQCMDADKADPSLSLAGLCEKVQGSGQGSLYGAWTKEAKKIVDAYGGGSGSTQSVHNYYKSYEFHRGPPDGPHNENTWDCSARLAQEVNWRRFVVGNSFFYVRDSDLIGSKPQMIVDESFPEIDDVSWDIDSGKPISEMEVKCEADRWFARPGEVALAQNQGPANGSWLVYTIHRGLFETQATITLRQPEASKPEPAPELVTVSTGLDTSGITTGGTIGGKNARDRIVKAAQRAASLGPSKYTYREVRPYPKSLFMKGTIITDCSGFAILCYKAAGVNDPNGTNYNGSGNTSSLMANGKQIHAGKLQPGDLVFYRSPEHVAVYIDNGKVIEFGGQGGPHELPINYRSDLIGYYTYDLGKSGGGSYKPGPSGRLAQYPH